MKITILAETHRRTRGKRRTHDDNGNLTLVDFSDTPSPSDITIKYDYRNRMVEYAEDGGQRHVYRYDALGRRIAKIVDADGASPTETRFLYFGPGKWQVIEEQNAVGWTVATYVYGNYIDEPITMRRDTDGDGTMEDYYFHGDDLHNVMAITDANGAVVERYEYDDFGRVEFRDALGAAKVGVTTSDFGNPYTFTGRRFDEETGLIHYRTRYLDPVAGRFTTRDTIGIWGDPMKLGNGLAYVGNNPWTYLDPMGLNVVGDFVTGVGVGAGIAGASAFLSGDPATKAAGGTVMAIGCLLQGAGWIINLIPTLPPPPPPPPPPLPPAIFIAAPPNYST